MIARASLAGLRSALPIASRLVEPRELLKAAILTRLGVGLLRIEENYPTLNRKPLFTTEQKYASFLERVFMEGFGVPFHVLTMYGLQEPVSKLFERSFLQLPTAEGLSSQFIRDPAHRQVITQAIQRVYQSSKGMVAKQLYEADVLKSKVGLVRSEVAQRIGKALTPELKEGINRVLMGYQRRLWLAAAATLSVGIVGSAYLSGYVLQWLNDYPVSKRVIPWILKKLGIASEAQHKPVMMPGPIPPPEQRIFRM